MGMVMPDLWLICGRRGGGVLDSGESPARFLAVADDDNVYGRRFPS